MARTGYTGEDGFEPSCRRRPRPTSGAGWSRRADRGSAARGPGARDTLRLEARMLLYGNDMDETTTLVEAGLGWTLSFDEAKGD